jgi:DNA repair exonuclease SbcCD ATPase subunit
MEQNFMNEVKRRLDTARLKKRELEKKRSDAEKHCGQQEKLIASLEEQIKKEKEKLDRDRRAAKLLAEIEKSSAGWESSCARYVGLIEKHEHHTAAERELEQAKKAGIAAELLKPLERKVKEAKEACEKAGSAEALEREEGVARKAFEAATAKIDAAAKVGQLEKQIAVRKAALDQEKRANETAAARLKESETQLRELEKELSGLRGAGPTRPVEEPE